MFYCIGSPLVYGAIVYLGLMTFSPKLVYSNLENRSLSQREICEILGITPSVASHLMNGEYHHFTEGKLLIFLKKLGGELTIHLHFCQPPEQGYDASPVGARGRHGGATPTSFMNQMDLLYPVVAPICYPGSTNFV